MYEVLTATTCMYEVLYLLLRHACTRYLQYCYGMQVRGTYGYDMHVRGTYGYDMQVSVTYCYDMHIRGTYCLNEDIFSVI